MGAGPHDRRVGLQRRLGAAIGIAAAAAIVEIVGSWLSGSLALLSDAGHVGTDAFALGLSLWALRVSGRPHTPGMTFASTDHRAHRKQEWLETSMRKVAQLDFLYGEGTGRTIGQAAMQFVLAQPTLTSVLPNILNDAQLREFVAAPDTPPLTADELDRIADLYDHDFNVEQTAAAESR